MNFGISRTYWVSVLLLSANMNCAAPFPKNKIAASCEPSTVTFEFLCHFANYGRQQLFGGAICLLGLHVDHRRWVRW